MRFCRACGVALNIYEIGVCVECNVEDGEEDDDDLL